MAVVADAAALPVSLCPEKEHRHANTVLYVRSCLSENQVAQQTVSVGAHGYEVAAVFLDPLDDLLGRRRAVGKLGVGGDATGFEFGLHTVQVGPSLFDLLAGRVRAAPVGHATVATWSSTTRLFMNLASILTCSMIARSVGVASKVTRIVLYITAAPLDPELPPCRRPTGVDRRVVAFVPSYLEYRGCQNQPARIS